MDLLHNIVWHALDGNHRHLSDGCDAARRYQRGVTDLIGFPDAAAPDFDRLRPYCAAGERFYCLGWTGPPPAGWVVEREARVVKMVWDAGEPTGTPALDAIRLDARHLGQAQALADLTQPGPFGPRSFELGHYHGLLDGDDLVAMAGERMSAGRLREISAVCTHPRAQGRGHARGLLLLLLRQQLGRGEIPFLHVLAHNEPALALYRKMGFRTFAETPIRIVRCSDA